MESVRFLHRADVLDDWRQVMRPLKQDITVRTFKRGRNIIGMGRNAVSKFVEKELHYYNISRLIHSVIVL